MSSNEKRSDELVEKLILDIKALVLLEGSDAELDGKLGAKLVGSQDQSIRRFVDAMQKRHRRSPFQYVAMALGELVAASLLVLAGGVAIVPTVAGANTPTSLLQFFTEHAYNAFAGSALSQYVSLLEFALGALLVLGAFYTLHQAAINLGEAGISVRSGES